MPEENKGTPIKITKVGTDTSIIETTIREAGTLVFWQNYFASKEVSARKGSKTSVNDLIK